MANREDAKARPPEEDGRSARSTATLFVSVLVIGLVVILGAFLTYQLSKGDSTPGAAAPPTAPASSSVATAAAPPAQGGSTSLTEAPAGTRWELYQGVALPYSTTAGPTTVQGLGVASGYTHDAEGALFAAAQIDTRRSLAPDNTWRSVVDTQVAPGQGRDTWIANRSTISIAPNSIPSTRLVQIAGFKVSNYTDTVATISIASKSSKGGFLVGDLTVTWVGGDWKLVLLPDGNSATTYPVTDLAVNGFIPWAGV
jgi:hypothetical protein